MSPGDPSDLDALRVLRAIVGLEIRGEDPYEASGAIAVEPGLSPETFEACLKRLVTGGYIHGGKYFSGPFVEGTTEHGRRTVAEWRSSMTALDHVLKELDEVIEKGESREARSRARSHAAWIRAHDVASDLDIIGALIDRERDDDT